MQGTNYTGYVRDENQKRSIEHQEIEGAKVFTTSLEKNKRKKERKGMR